MLVELVRFNNQQKGFMQENELNKQDGRSVYWDGTTGRVVEQIPETPELIEAVAKSIYQERWPHHPRETIPKDYIELTQAAIRAINKYMEKKQCS